MYEDEEDDQKSPPPVKPSWILLTIVAFCYEGLAAFLDLLFGAGLFLDYFVTAIAGIHFYIWLTARGQRPGFWFWSLGGLQMIPVLGPILAALPFWPGVILASYFKSKSKVLTAISSGKLDPTKIAGSARAASRAAMRGSLKKAVGRAGTAGITDSMRASARRAGTWAAIGSVGKEMALAEARMHSGVTANAVLTGRADWKKYAEKATTNSLESMAGVNRKKERDEPKSWDELTPQTQAA